jgi:hypothetical protein
MKNRNGTLKKKMQARGLTTDCGHYVDPQAQAFIGMLTDIATFAKKYGLTQRGVLRHVYVGDIPCVFISGIAFVLDLGPEEFSRSLGWELGPEHIDIIEKLLKEELAGKLPPLHLRRKKAGHTRHELMEGWRKDELNQQKFMKIGY